MRGPPRHGQDKITVLATYVAQVGSLRRKLQSDGLGDVRVASVDNFQGEENDIILLSLVRNDGAARRREPQEGDDRVPGDVQPRLRGAGARAERAVYFWQRGITERAVVLWKDALEDLRGRGGLGGGLPLVPRFRDGDDAVRYVSSARDVEAVLEDVGEVVPPPAPVEE